MTTFFAGDDLAAADLNGIEAQFPLACFKTSDTSRASTTSVSLDPDLQVTLPAAKKYVYFGVIHFNGDTTGDMKGGMAAPSGGGVAGTDRSQSGTATATAGSIVTDRQTGTGFGHGCLGTGTDLTALLMGRMDSGSGGAAGFSWAQSASSATATTIRGGSFLMFFPVG